MSTAWAPWEKFKPADEEPLLPIPGPPCSTCVYWQPRRKYRIVHPAGKPPERLFDGVVCCTVANGGMCHDFSCFRAPPQAVDEGIDTNGREA